MTNRVLQCWSQVAKNVVDTRRRVLVLKKQNKRNKSRNRKLRLDLRRQLLTEWLGFKLRSCYCV